MVNVYATVPTWLAGAGIVWDLSGAIALSRAFFLFSTDSVEKEASAYFGPNPTRVRASCQQWLDTRFGFMQLATGFILQFLSSAGLAISLGIAVWIVCPIAFVWIIFLSNYRYWEMRRSMKICANKGYREEKLRESYPDVSELQWQRVIWNEGLFASPPSVATEG